MTRNEYISALRGGLSGLSAVDINRSVDFYKEMIDDRIEDGMSERAAVASLCPPREAARQILAERPIGSLIKARAERERSRGALRFLLLILGSPVWLPLLIVFSVVPFVLALSLAITVLSVFLAFAAGGIGALALSAVYFGEGSAALGLVLLGGGAFLAGLSILSFFACPCLVRGCLGIGKLLFRGVKALIIGRG